MESPFAVELFVFSSGVGRLHWYFPSAPNPVVLDLPARFVRVLVLLQAARDLDQASDRIPPSLQGYRKADAIALLYDSVAPEASTITRYLSDLCILMANVPGAMPLIERVRYRGARLLHQIKVSYIDA